MKPLSNLAGLMERCTLTQIATAARLSVSTVSMALRNHPRISTVTKQRVERIARRLGYKAHPSVAALMAHIRSGRQPSSREVIAFVWVEAQPTQLTVPFNRHTVAGARHRAEQLGYGLEEFWLSKEGMTARRLSDILKARGITGVVFSGCERQTGVTLEMDWSAFAAAVIGNAPWTPELHRAGHHHFLAMCRVLDELSRRGYRRPALLVDNLVNERSARGPEAAFVTHHPSPDEAPGLVRKLASSDVSAITSWVRKVRPDAIIAGRPAFLTQLRNEGASSVSSAIGLVDLDVTGDPDVTGIDPGHRLVAAHAVDLVVEQLFRNERGIPDEPKKVLFEGRWVEGRTLRALAPRGVPATA